jgi:hypothetical protein
MKLFNSKTIFLLFLCFHYLFNAFSCAAIQAPSGGPKDDTPPILLYSIPATGTTNFDQSIVQLFFSEYILERSIFDAISLLPKTDDPIQVKYKGKELVVKLPESLLIGQTYILSINRNLKDENGVSLSEGIQLAFSTGNTIDKSKINGKLFSKEETSALLWKIRDSLDSEEFFLRQPDYTIDASEDGHFSFNYLSNGSYKILGLNRSKLNERLEPNYSIYGISSTDVIKIDSASTFKKDVNILIPRVSKYIRVVNGKWINSRRGEINFDAPISEKLDYVTIEITSGEERILPDLFVDNIEKNTLHFFVKDSLKPGLNTVINVIPRDNAEYSIIDSALISAKTKSDIDTTYLNINDVEKMNNLEIEEDLIRPFDFSFSKLMYNVIIDSALTLRKDSVIIDFNLEKLSPMHYRVIPKKNWIPNTDYNLFVMRDKLKMANTRGIKDSLLILNIKTSPFRKFGSLTGNLIEKHNEPLVARLSSLEKEQYFLDVFVNSNSSFKINKIPEGIYSLMFYNDRDENDYYSHGSLSPYQSSEWFEIIPDTISIRSNWDMEITNIKLNSF